MSSNVDVVPELWLPPSVQRHSTAVRRFKPRSLSELGQRPVRREWLWEGLAAQGLVTMLAGSAFAGKSMLIGGLFHALNQGVPFLGQATRSANALLVTEEDELSVNVRAARFGLRTSSSHVVTREISTVTPWPELISEATRWALRHEHTLLVVDPFATLAGLRPEEENDAAAVTARLRPLVRAAAAGLAVLFVHHVNRGGQPRGSTAFEAVVDIAIRLQRKDRSDVITLKTKSREVEVPELNAKLIRAPDNWFYEPQGVTRQEDAARTPESDQRLLAALKEAGARGLTYEEIDRLPVPGLTEAVAKNRLPAWFKEDLPGLTRTGLGRRGDPYRWSIVSVSVSTT